MYHTAEVYFGKSPALNFFDAVPYGLTANELCSWINSGGGQVLWDEVDAQFNMQFNPHSSDEVAFLSALAVVLG
jgi:TRAP-type mannitol/chloroaromatic compound transport system substrate-binding protein